MLGMQDFLFESLHPPPKHPRLSPIAPHPVHTPCSPERCCCSKAARLLQGCGNTISSVSSSMIVSGLPASCQPRCAGCEHSTANESIPTGASSCKTLTAALLGSRITHVYVVSVMTPAGEQQVGGGTRLQCDAYGMKGPSACQTCNSRRSGCGPRTVADNQLQPARWPCMPAKVSTDQFAAALPDAVVTDVGTAQGCC